jgi:Thiol-activated cytolysin/FG-GAP-like repeat
MRFQKMMPRSLAGTMFLALATGCGQDPVQPPLESADENVEAFLAGLPTWASYTADVNSADQAPAPTGSAEPRPDEVVSLKEYEDDGSVTVIPDVTYQCTSTPYSMTTNPREIVMYDPDVAIVWPGALIQGKSRKALGSFVGIPIAERTPIRISIPSFATGDNFRVVEQPNEATVASAWGEIVGNATESGLAASSAIDFEMNTHYSEEFVGLSASLSGAYLGYSASASGDFSRNASETTLTANFIQRMFTVTVGEPQTPGAFFSSDFTEAKLQEQVNLGRMGADNIPIYVSEVVYGRMMAFSMTSSASETDIRATIQAAYDGIGGNVEASLTARQRKILADSKIAVTSVGGNAQATLDVIRSGNWASYFTNEAPLSSAAPLSYTFRNLGDGSIAGVTESTDYEITSCQAIPATPGTFSFLDPQVEAAPFTGGVQTLTGDVNGDGRTDMIWNQLQQGTNQLFVGISAGDGTFAFSAPFVHPESPVEGWGNYTVDVAYVDDDAYVDLVWNYLGTDNKTYIGLGNGDGTFGTPSVRIHSANGWGAYDLLVGDAMGPTGVGDGLDDLVWVRWNTGSLGVYGGMSQGNSQFDNRPFRSLSSGTWAGYSLLPANVDGDSDMDFVLNVRAGTNRTYAVTSDGDDGWTLQPFSDNSGTNDWSGFAVRAGDVTGLGSQALIWADTAGVQNYTSVGQWNGSGFDFTPLESAQYRSPSDPPLSIEVGDVDGDGDADIIWSARSGPANRTYVSLGQGDGTFDFSAQSQLHPDDQTNWSQYQMFVGDVNGDGRDDIIWNWPAATNRIYTAIGKN